MKDSDLIPGRCYYSLNYQKSLFNYLFKYEGNLKCCRYIDANVNVNMLFNNGIFTNEVTREASPEETHWMEECIKHGIFISFDDAMKTFPKSYTSCFSKELIHLLKQLKLI